MPFDLPLIIEKEQLPEVPEALRGLYREKEGKLHFDAAPKSDIHRFMDSNRAINSEMEALKKKYEGLDPDLAKKALEEKKALEQKRALEAGQFEQILGQTKAEAEAERAKIKAEYEAKLQASIEREAKYVRGESITKAALEAGVLKEAIDDVLLHASVALKVVDGKLIDSDGKEVRADVWLKGLLATKKHWLGNSVGGGTSKDAGANVPSGNLKRSKMNHEEKAAYQKTHGMAAYHKLPL